MLSTFRRWASSAACSCSRLYFFWGQWTDKYITILKIKKNRKYQPICGRWEFLRSRNWQIRTKTKWGKKKIPADLRELRFLDVRCVCDWIKELEVDRRLLLPRTAGLVGGVKVRPMHVCMCVCMYTYIHVTSSLRPPIPYITSSPLCLLHVFTS